MFYQQRFPPLLGVIYINYLVKARQSGFLKGEEGIFT